MKRKLKPSPGVLLLLTVPAIHGCRNELARDRHYTDAEPERIAVRFGREQARSYSHGVIGNHHAQ